MLKPRVILIVPDDQIRQKLGHLLSQLGFSEQDTYSCRSLADVGPLNGNLAEFVITDISGPADEAETMYREIKSKLPGKQFVFIGKAGNRLGQEIKRLGTDDYLEIEEINPASLASILHRASGKTGPAVDYRRLFEECPIPMYIFERSSLRFLEANEAALRQYGYTKEEFLAMTAEDIRPADTLAQFRSIQSNIPGEFKDYGRWQHRRRDGRVFWVKVYAHEIGFDGSKARMVIAIDVDEQVRMEQALQEKLRERQRILDSITDAFMLIDKQHHITFVNQRFEQILQTPAEEVQGKDVWRMFPEAKGRKFYSEYQRAISERVSVHYEEYYPPMDIWLLVNGYPSEDGFSVFFIDITKEKKLQDAIALNQQNLSAIVNNTTDMIWSVDRDYRFITTNNRFHEMVAKLRGKTTDALRQEDFDSETYNRWLGFYDRALAGEPFVEIERYVIDGKENFQQVSFNPIRNELNEVIGISCFSRDITEQQQHIRMIEEQNERFKQITWMQCHEMRRPVANILGLIALLDINSIPEGETREVMRHLATSAKQLDDMIRQVTLQAQEVSGSG